MREIRRCAIIMTVYSFKTIKVVPSVFKTDKLSKIVWSYVPLENSALGLCTDAFFCHQGKISSYRMC